MDGVVGDGGWTLGALDPASVELSLGGLLARSVAVAPTTPAVVFDDESLTFAELEARVARLAGGLAEAGIGRGDRVALWLPSSPEWVEWQFALARLGAVAVSVNTRFRTREVQDILMRTGARTLVVWPTFLRIDFLGMLASLDPDAVAGIDRLVLVRHGDGDAGLPPTLDAKVVRHEELLAHQPLEADLGDPDDVCVVFTSSGTTSAPKLVQHRQGAVTEHALAVAGCFGYDEADAVLLDTIPLCGIFGFGGLMGAIAGFRPTVLVGAFDPAEAVGLIERHRATHVLGGDDMLLRILDCVERPEQVRSLRSGMFGIFSGRALELVTRADALGIRFFTSYGSSEIFSLFCYKRADADAEDRATPGGVPVDPAVRIRVRDPETGTLLPPGQPGELEVGGPTVTVGLMNDPERSAMLFSDDGFLRTGDVGYTLEDDRIVFLRRLGDTLRLGGFLVSPGEIEEYLQQLDCVGTAQVVGVRTSSGDLPVAFVVPGDDSAFDEAAIISCCRRDIARFKVPRRVIAMDEMPLVASPNGNKIDRRELAARAEAILSEEMARR
jgi:fatty-acyl-CoA synthase